jgi:Family of unknown function (DUF6495)
MQFRKLTLAELHTLEAQFIQFLAVNTVTAKDWENIKREKPDRANALIEEFSDVVFGSVTENAKYLVHADKQAVLVFYFGEDKVIIYGLTTDENIDFAQQKNIRSAIAALSDKAILHTFTQVKPFSKKRAQEIFDVLESGAKIAEEQLFLEVQQLHLKA